MKQALTLLLGGLAAAVISLPAAAQPVFRTLDCSKSRDPARCEARQTAREACKEKRGSAKRQCREDQIPPPDCSKSRNPETCAATVAARAACRGKSGPEHRLCLREQIKHGPAKK